MLKDTLVELQNFTFYLKFNEIAILDFEILYTVSMIHFFFLTDNLSEPTFFVKTSKLYPLNATFYQSCIKSLYPILIKLFLSFGIMAGIPNFKDIEKTCRGTLKYDQNNPSYSPLFCLFFVSLWKGFRITEFIISLIKYYLLYIRLVFYTKGGSLDKHIIGNILLT